MNCQERKKENMGKILITLSEYNFAFVRFNSVGASNFYAVELFQRNVIHSEENPTLKVKCIL